MSIWTLFQVLFNLTGFIAVVALWMRLRRPPQDDPRLSRGLQLLQTKITVLEDLSDRTDLQVKQLSALLDQKTRVVQNKIIEAEQQVVKIDHSMNKSLEVAEIFQDKIPHQEILERQRTVEYVKAARMAHSGLSVDEISKTVHLPREQIDLIAKFNREQLMFDETQLPGWAKREVDGDSPSFALNDMDFVSGLEPRTAEYAKIDSNFKQAVQSANVAAAHPPHGILDSKMAETLRETAQNFKDRLVATAEEILSPAPRVITPPPSAPQARPQTTTFSLNRPQSPVVRGDSATVKKVIFPRIEK